MTVLAPRPAPGGRRPLPAQDPIAALPVLMLTPHSSCNCKCIMCDIWRDRRGLDLSIDRLNALLPELVQMGVKRVCLTGGEPLMHRDLRTLCAALRGANIAITMLSTGLLLEKHAAWLGESIDDIVVSLDGPREVHDDIRRVRTAFDVLAKGVAAVRAAAPAVRLTARCTVQAANAHLLRETVDAAHALGLDGISFLPADVSSHAFGRDLAGEETTARPAVTGAHLPALRRSITALEQTRAADFASGFIIESPSKLRTRVLAHFEALAGERDWPTGPCNAPWVSSVLDADGTVRPCFFLPPFGNAFVAGGLGTVINHADAQRFRQSLDVTSHPVCQRCVCRLHLSEGDRV